MILNLYGLLFPDLVFNKPIKFDSGSFLGFEQFEYLSFCDLDYVKFKNKKNKVYIKFIFNRFRKLSNNTFLMAFVNLTSKRLKIICMHLLV